MSIGHLYVVFGKVSIQDLSPFFHWVSFFVGIELYKFFFYFNFFLLLFNYSCLHFLPTLPPQFINFGYNLFSDVLANMFSHLVGCLFILLMVFFAVQKLFSLMQSHLLIFFLFPLPEEMYHIKYYYEQCLRFYCLCFLLEFLWFWV